MPLEMEGVQLYRDPPGSGQLRREEKRERRREKREKRESPKRADRLLARMLRVSGTRRTP